MKTESEIYALRSQINPHFLYNTLQCMGGIALMNDQPLVAEMASNMAEIFRYSIKEGDKVTVREETDFLKKYLDICDVRFNGRFRWEMEMEEGIGELPIDKMILQPLVENAVYHGLEKRTEPGGMLWIKGCREGQSLVFFIIDNGGRLGRRAACKAAGNPGGQGAPGAGKTCKKTDRPCQHTEPPEADVWGGRGAYRGREGRKGDCDSETSHRRNGHFVKN